MVYEYVEATIVLGEPAQLSAHPALGRLLVLGFVSAVDDYFRRVLAGVVHICPNARRRVADRTIPFGAFDYYDAADSALALFEFQSFASVKDVRSATRFVVGSDLPEVGSLGEALNKYEWLCHIRHATTHAGGRLSSRSARALGSETPSSAQSVTVDFDGVHTAAAITYSAVRAYNAWLYNAVLDDWIKRENLVGTWTVDRALVTPLFNLCRSRHDAVAPATSYNAWRSMTPTIRKRLAAAAAADR